jgi:hypothetical protein
MNPYKQFLRPFLEDPAAFAEFLSGLRLRAYQVPVARAIAHSVLEQRGLSFVVLFPRQSGKNELQAQIEAYLLARLCSEDAGIVKITPTWKPQAVNAMLRLARVLDANLLTRANWTRESGYIFRLERARIFFLSGSPQANIVGATASTLLEVDEAQDVQINKYDKDIAPMAASTNATRVFWGTAWTSRTLLARELRAARAAEQRDGQPRVFTLTADDVAREVPEYGAFVAGQIARLGRGHPMVRTQFFCEEIDGAGGMFPPARTALMRGTHQAMSAPGPLSGRRFALLLDVAGESVGGEGESLSEPVSGKPGGRRDSTALTVVEIDLASLGDPLLRAPTYRVMQRRLWTGTAHTRLYGEIQALAELWQASQLVVDATGVGAGLASFLARALPGRVTPFIFNSASKSQLGWDFLAVVDSGRWKEPGGGSGWEYPGEQEALQRLFFDQLAACQYEVLPGPARSLRWGVPPGARDARSGDLIHDDLVLSAALCAQLDRLPLPPPATPPAIHIVRAKDPLDGRMRF